MTTFIKLHHKNKPFMINVDGIFSIDEKIKGVGSIIMDFGGDVRDCDEKPELIEALFLEYEIEILNPAND